MGLRTGDESIDWAAVASVLAQLSTAAVALLTRDHRFAGANGEFERLLGWTAAELEDQCWLELLTPTARVDVSHRLLVAARQGDVRVFELDVLARRGEQLTLSLEARSFGSEANGGLALVVRGNTPSRESARMLQRYHVHFGDERWRLLGAAPGGALGSLACHQALYRRDVPCEACPLRPDPTRTRAVVRCAPTGLEYVDAATVGPEVAEVSVIAIAESTLSALHEGRLRALAARARLSAREVEVLMRLVVGDTPAEIAATLGITPRTVRFHQYNAFGKLGVDSLLDLLRRFL